MPKKRASEKLTSGRKLSLTIIVGIFIAIMIITLVNLIVDYAYSPPKYEDYCKTGMEFNTRFPEKVYPGFDCNSMNCTFNKLVNGQAEKCSLTGGQPVYDYDDSGCVASLRECNFCQTQFNDAIKEHNRKSFFIFAAIGFILIVVGLFSSVLLVQILALPAGAVLVIEAAVKNFDSKLMVIITFALLIAAAVYLALKKLR